MSRQFQTLTQQSIDLGFIEFRVLMPYSLTCDLASELMEVQRDG